MSRRLIVRRIVIVMAVLFWLAVMAIAVYAFYSMFKPKAESAVVALHHLSVGILLLSFSGVGMYTEIVRANATRSRRRYCLEYQLSSFIYLVAAGFVVDPLPTTKEAAPAQLQTFFAVVAVLGVVLSAMKCGLGFVDPSRVSVVSSGQEDDYELSSQLRERLNNQSCLYTPRRNERSVDPEPALYSTTSGISTSHTDSGSPDLRNPFTPRGARAVPVPEPQRQLSRYDSPARSAPSDDATNPFASDVRNAGNPFDEDVTPDKVSRKGDVALCRTETNPFEPDIEKAQGMPSNSNSSNPFDPE